MTHPHHLHATAAAWSLHAALARLAQLADDEARAITAERLAPADGLQAWRPVIGRSFGSHADPAGSAALTRLADEPPINPSAELAERAMGTLAWLADQLHTPIGSDPLARLQAAIPTLQPGTAATLCRWMAEADARIRTTLGLDPDEILLTGAACPSCGIRQLHLQTAAPTAEHTVVCAAGCRCVGTSCTCGMAIRIEGVAHIWNRSSLVAG